MDNNIELAYQALAAWCSARDYRGYDPFDGLNSRVFKATPFHRWRTARLVWTQIFKRSPVNLRRLARVPPERNSKGMALFALAALARVRSRPSKAAEAAAHRLLDDLCAMQLSGWSGVAWGYNFDWQGRAFFAPRGTPTVVPTAFAARALVEGAGVLGRESYLQMARSACDFILLDLHRGSDREGEACFSYSPLDRTRVLNASLLAAETLARVGALTGESDLIDLALQAARYVVRLQNRDGSWPYGADGYQSWSDNFHTAFVLTSLSRVMACSGNEAGEFTDALERGYGFWRERFFLGDGWPKYFLDRLFPADAHSAGTAILAFLELKHLDPGALELAKKVALWALRDLRDHRGFFYYQRRRFYTIHTPYMRWSQAWMLYALARLLEEHDGC
jgi:hypothetical protein